MSVKLGLNAKLYRNSGSYGSPTWVEIDCVQNLTLSDSMSEADVTRRASGGVKEYQAALRDIGVEFDCPNVDDDTNVDFLRDTYAARTAVDYAIMDEAIANSGAHGVRFWGQLFKRDRAEELENGQMLSYTLKPTCAANAPSEMNTA